MDPNEIQQVRKIIESSTSKVSLRDLEKKGFRKVKVLRSNDIDELIRRAVTAVVAREGGDEARVSEEIVEQSRRELREMMAQQQADARERAEIEHRAETLEHMAQELKRRLAEREGEASGLRRRLEDVEARAIANETLAAEGRDASERLAELEQQMAARASALGKEAEARKEADARAAAAQAETARRLFEEFEIPKLKARIGELEAELRAAQAAAVAAPKGGADEEKMRAMFRDILKEAGAAAGGAPVAGDALKAEFAKLQTSIADTLARAGGREKVTDADLDVAKVSLEALFKHDAERPILSNIDDVKVKEQTTTSDLKSKLDKLKALRKGGKEEK